MKKLILVTGSHRSGSTWTGNVIRKAPNTRYVHEPFNIEKENKNSPLTFWFEHVLNAPLSHQKKTKHYINSYFKVVHPNTIKRLPQQKSLKSLYHYFADLKSRMTTRTVLKDPIALMSAEWIYKNYKADVVVLIRHPAAFIASLKVKNWEFDFNNYLNQPLLMDGYLKDYKTVIADYCQNKKDIIDQGILLWNTIHDVIDYYQSNYKNEWHFVKHEDLSHHPTAEFKKLFSKIELTMNSAVSDYIKETTTSKEDSYLTRNSKDNIKEWKNRLSDNEIQRIKKGTQNVWEKFYSESDW